MTVPITSDLVGYQAFWLKLSAAIVCALVVILIPIYWGLWKLVRVAETIQFILSIQK